MNDDDVKGPVEASGLVDHLLEDGPTLVECRGTWLREDLDHLPTLTLAIVAALGDLIGQSQVVLGLPHRRDPHIDGSADHDASFLSKEESIQLLSEIGSPDGQFFTRRGQMLRQIGADCDLTSGVMTRAVAAITLGAIVVRPRNTPT